MVQLSVSKCNPSFSQNVINSMGGMEVFLPLLEQVEYKENKSCEETKEKEMIWHVATDEKNILRLVWSFYCVLGAVS